MPQVKELLVEQLKDLLHAESQLLNAIPKMAEAANHGKLREAFEKHLQQTNMQVERLRQSFALLGEEAEPKTCHGMMGLIQEGEEMIEESGSKDAMAADLGLAAAAQKVEHYEISAYGTARTLALQLNEKEVARLLSASLGEEESTDFLLTELSKPILQELMAGEFDTRKTSVSAPRMEQESAPGRKKGGQKVRTA